MTPKELAEKIFQNHKATLLTDSPDLFSISWKNPESRNYYIKYILDKTMGTLIIQGDCGYAVATWQSPKKPQAISNLINDIPYFASKLKCSTDKYQYDEDETRSDLKEAFREIKENIYAESQKEKQEEFEEDFSEICQMIIQCQPDNLKYPDELYELLDKYDESWWENPLINHAGRRLDERVYLWAYGFRMALKQLEDPQTA